MRVMTADTPIPFKDLLRRYRKAADLTQEALAERAGLSARTISDLERGVNDTPRKDTLAPLAAALDLSPADRATLEAAAHRLDGRSASHADSARESVPHNLPAPVTPLIGRDDDIATVRALLARGDVRLLTVTGPGGVGKTRLSTQVAAELLPSFPDGVFFVDLAPLDDPTLVVATVAREVGVAAVGDRPVEERLAATLAGRRILLLLDNFERVVAAAPAISGLLAACPRLAVLATSRALLRVRGEHCLVTPPLPAADARRLFVERARALRPDLAVEGETATAIDGICARLDGLPLAIELAAAHVRLLSPPALLARLERRLPLPCEGARDLPERQRTLRETIAWSCAILDPDALALFRRLAVFAGGCTPEAVRHVCLGEEGVDDPAEILVLERISSLADQSLARVEYVEYVDGNGQAESRVTLLETIRAYALDCLTAAGEDAEMRRRHAVYYRDLAEAAEPALIGERELEWLDRLDAERDNMRAALHWAWDAGETATGLRLAAALWRFWHARGPLGEGRGWLNRFLARDAGGHVVDAVRARAFNGAGVLAAAHADYSRAAACFEECVALRQAVGDARGVVAARSNLASIAKLRGDYDRAEALLEETLIAERGWGDKWAIAVTLGDLGEVARLRGDYAWALTWAEESVALYRSVGDRHGVAVSLQTVAGAFVLRGDYARAERLYDECLALWRIIGDKIGLAECLDELAHALSLQGDAGRVERLLDAAEALRDEAGAPHPASNPPRLVLLNPARHTATEDTGRLRERVS